MKAMIRRPASICVLIVALALPGLLGTAGCPSPEPQPPAGDFVGAAPCAQCHANVHANWSQTLHASAIDTLASVGQADNPGCQPCHTTGFGEPGGFADLATTPQFANVQCEACHGPAGPHIRNVSDASLRPAVPVASEVCGKCHTTDTYPHFPQWQISGHAVVTQDPADDFTAATLLSNCGPCHSGDYRYQAIIAGETNIPGDLLAGVPRQDQNAVTCIICHDPHTRTGNAVNPDGDRDFQLRYPEVAGPEPTNSIDVVRNENRYNLCGHCHRSRGVVWTATSRAPHHSIQSNLYIGEMPMPAGQEATPLVPNTRSVHRFVPAQCATCHVFREESPSPFAPPIAGHTFAVNDDSCSSAVGCHPSPADAQTDEAALQAEVQTRLDAIAARLGPLSTWGYSNEGGPPAGSQAAIPDAIKQVRYLYFYTLNDGSLGVHNPAYVRAMLTRAETLLTSIGK
jgi:hypothetical protein